MNIKELDKLIEQMEFISKFITKNVDLYLVNLYSIKLKNRRTLFKELRKCIILKYYKG